MQNIHIRTWIAVGAALVVIAYVFWQGLWSPLVAGLTAGRTPNTAQNAAANFSLPADGTNPPAGDGSAQQAVPNLAANQIGVIDVKAGEGKEAKVGGTVTVQYDGYLTDGTKFDSSRGEGRTPFTFTLGAGQVIPGFDKGVTGMKVGGIRRIVIPPALGYGAQAVGKIPANSTLLFEVELVSVK